MACTALDILFVNWPISAYDSVDTLTTFERLRAVGPVERIDLVTSHRHWSRMY
jgi:hypothetical protein